MKIRQHKILTRTLLILFIINFTLAAPTAVRERPEVRLDANVRRDVTAAPQKRWDPLDEEGLTNVPRAGDALPPGAPPPILDSTGWVQRYPIPLSATNARPLSAPPPGLRPPSAPAPRPQPPSAPSPSAPLLRVPALSPRPLRLQPPIAPSLSSPPPGLQPPSALPSGLRPPSAPTGLVSPSLLSTNWAQGVRMTLSVPNPWPPSAPPGLRPPSTPSPSASPPGVSPPDPLLPPPRPPRPLLPRPLPFRAPPPRIRRPVGRPARQGRPRRRPQRPLLPNAALPSGLLPQSLDSTDLSPTAWIDFNTPSAKTLPLPLAERPGSSIGNVLPSPGPPTGSRLPVAGSLTSPPPLPHASQPGPSEDRFPKPPGFSENSDASSSIGNQPRPGVNSETHSVPNSGDLSPEFWNNLWNEFPSGIRDDFLKGKIKPRTFDSDAVPEEPKIIEICMGRESGMSIQDGNFD